MADTAECSVCLESRRNLITCIKCDTAACLPCTKQYLLSSSQKAHCSKCKLEWSEKYLLQTCGTNWAEKIYRPHFKNLLINREKARLPEAVAIYSEQQQKKKEEARKKQLLITLRAKEHALVQSIQKGMALKKSGSRNEEIDTSSKRGELHVIRAEIQKLKSRRPPPEKPHKTRIEFICPCPVEDCRGLVENETHLCKICDAIICRKCRQVQTENHVCREEDVALVKTLKSDSKPCPKCAVSINKISGCPQMFCTHCQTVFDWNTLKIDTGIVHNPHAVEWRSRNRHLLQEDPDVCGRGLPEVFSFTEVYYNLSGEVYMRNGSRKLDKLLIETGGHLERMYVVIAETFEKEHKHIPDTDPFLEINMDYVGGKIDEVTWKRRIFLKERNLARQKAEEEIYTTGRDIFFEMFRRLLQNLRKKVEGNPLAEMTKELRDFLPPECPTNPSENVALHLYLEFLQEANAARKFINEAYMKELPLLGMSKPPQIPTLE